MNLLQLSLLLAILLKCAFASESVVKGDVLEVIEEPGFESIRRDWEKWKYRTDLFDYMIMKNAEFIAGFINQVRKLKRAALAALFIKRLDIVDEVLKKIKYDDHDLKYLTSRRPELAESHGKFFKLIDKIKKLRNQELAVELGVFNLFKAKKHDSVIPLINALEKSTLSRNVKVSGIQQAFSQGAIKGIKNIVEELHKHPAIASERYARGLVESWKYDQSRKMVFPFLLDQADQGDLKVVKKRVIYLGNSKFRKTIDDAHSKAELAGTRNDRFFDKSRAKIAIITLNDIMNTKVWMQEPGNIIAFYLVGEQKGRNVKEVLNTVSENDVPDAIKKGQEQREREKEKCLIM